MQDARWALAWAGAFVLLAYLTAVLALLDRLLLWVPALAAAIDKMRWFAKK